MVRLHHLLPLLLAGCVRFQTGPSITLPANERVQLEGRGQIHVIDRAATDDSLDAQGGAEAVLLVHGYGSSTASYMPIVPELNRHHRVIAIDLPGFGLSDRREGDYSPDALADVLADVLDQKRVHRVHLVGHSWGSSIVLAFALRHPERLARLVIISGYLYDEQVLPFMLWTHAAGIGEWIYAMEYTQATGEKLYFNFYDPRWVTAQLVEDVEKNLHRPGTVAAALAAARGMRFSKREKRHRDIVAETLLLWGQEDRVARPLFGAKLARELPRARLVTFPGCGHIPMIECRGPTSAALTDFLDREAN